jgi:hypothetical protein
MQCLVYEVMNTCMVDVEDPRFKIQDSRSMVNG